MSRKVGRTPARHKARGGHPSLDARSPIDDGAAVASSRRLAGEIEIYVRVAELRSFRRAASALGLTSSGVSKSVSRLEKQLGVKLLERSTRNVCPTAEGETLLEHGRRALGEIETARVRLSHARERVEGVVRIEAWPFLGQTIIAPALPELLRGHPGLVVQLSLRDQPRDPGEHDIDIAVCIAPPDGNDVVVRKACTLGARAVLCAAPAYLASAGIPKAIDDLRAHACLGFLIGDQVQPWSLATPGGLVSVVPRGPLVSTSKEVLVAAAVNGLGITRLADRTIASLVEARALEVVLEDHATLESVPVFVARPGGRWIPRRTRVVLQFLLDLFAREGW